MLETQLTNAYNALKKGGLILYPTDTLWAIGCDATNYKAVKKLEEIKQRSSEKNGFLCLIDSMSRMEKYVGNIPDVAIDILKASSTPTTIIYQDGYEVAENVLSKSGSIAMRITKHVFCKSLIKLLKKPIVSTSANLSGEKPAITLNEISKTLISKVDYTVNIPSNCSGKASSIISIKDNLEIAIIRP